MDSRKRKSGSSRKPDLEKEEAVGASPSRQKRQILECAAHNDSKGVVPGVGGEGVRAGVDGVRPATWALGGKSDPQVRFLDVIVVQQFLAGPLQDHAAVLEHVGPVAQGEGLADVLLHEKDGHPLPVDLLYCVL